MRDFIKVRVSLKFSVEESLNGHKAQYEGFHRMIDYRHLDMRQVADDPLVYDLVVTKKAAAELSKLPYVDNVSRPPLPDMKRTRSRMIQYRAHMKDFILR